MTNKTNSNTNTPIERLSEFVRWAISQKLCKSVSDFEKKCGLCNQYISNNKSSGKGNIGTEMLGRIVRVYPQLNLAWICTGEGPMVLSGEVDGDYRQAYEGAMIQVDALNNIIRRLNKEP